MKINIDKTKKQILDNFGWSSAGGIAIDVVERIDAYDPDTLWEEIGSTCIYYDTLWDIVKYYINPQDIGNTSLDDILIEFEEDIKKCIVLEVKQWTIKQ